MVDSITSQHPVICKAIGGATYIARMHFDKVGKMKVEDRLMRLMEEKIKQMKG